jgi:hypothetical protein
MSAKVAIISDVKRITNMAAGWMLQFLAMLASLLTAQWNQLPPSKQESSQGGSYNFYNLALEGALYHLCIVSVI